MKIAIEDIKKLREQTGAGIGDCQVALEEAGGNFKKALEILKSKGAEIVAKKSARTTGQGLVETYVHGQGRIAAMVEINCETDFVARTADFRNLAHELALQIASMNPSSVEELLKQDYIRDVNFTVDQLIKSVIAKLGENIQVSRFERIALGE